ncbi:MAG: hypothetical protein IPH84_17480 [Bacteroidales bacterium]|nr:hypothetical protein [Bacteroidales bacterium]
MIRKSRLHFEGETQTPGACPDAYTITRTWKAVDNCGNEATASQIITVQDVTDPALTVLKILPLNALRFLLWEPLLLLPLITVIQKSRLHLKEKPKLLVLVRMPIPSPAPGKQWTTVEMKLQPAKSLLFRM